MYTKNYTRIHKTTISSTCVECYFGCIASSEIDNVFYIHLRLEQKLTGNSGETG